MLPDAVRCLATRCFCRTLLLAGSALLLGMPGLAAAVEEGDRAPEFQVPSLGGGAPVSLAEHRGKVVYLDFWASWCPPCLKSLPLLDDMRKEFPESEFQIVAVNLDRNTKDALKFLSRHPVGYPSATDPKGRVPERFGLQKMPTSYLIDRDGVVRYVHGGFRPADMGEIRSRVAKLVAKKTRK